MTDKSPPFDRVLATCVESVLTGRASIQDCLDRYPQYRQELSDLLPVAQSLRRAPDVKPSLHFRMRSRDRLVARLPDRGPVTVTFWDRIRTSLMKPQQNLTLRRSSMSWVLIGSLVVALLGGGGVGVAYAADGSSPGHALYGVDQAMEATQMALASSPEGRAELALAFAHERALEAQTLANQGGSTDAIAQAAAGYQSNIQEAAEALAEVAATGDAARAEALRELLATSLAAHETTLNEVASHVPQEAAPAIQEAIDSSSAGRQAVEGLFEEDRPTGPPEDAGPSDDTGRPEGAAPPGSPPAGSEDSDERSEDGAPESVEERIAGLDEHIANAQEHTEDGDHDAAQLELEEYETEVDDLAQDLASMATEDEARAQALAALLDEALSRHTEVLTQLAEQLPAESQGYILEALESSTASRELVGGLFSDGMPAGPPSSFPGGATGE